MATQAPRNDNRDLQSAGISNFINGVEKKPHAQQSTSMVMHGDQISFKTVDPLSAPSRKKASAAGGGGSMQDYGARKRMPQSAADKNDRIINLEKENNVLKEKENLLKSEVTKMQTKLHRIEGLIRSRSHLGSAGGDVYDAREMQRDLQEEFDELKQKNVTTKDRVRKLNVIHRGLASRPQTASKPNKYAHVSGKLEVTHTKVTQQYQKLAEDLRAQMVVNQREVLRLQQEMNAINERTSGLTGPENVEKIRAEIQHMFQSTRDINVEIQKLQNNFASNENIFKQTKQYTGEIQQQIRNVAAANEQLKHDNFKLQLTTQEVAHINEEISQINTEREGIERSLRQIATEPFMRKEGQSVASRIADLELRVKERTAVAMARKEEEAKLSTANRQKKTELQKLQGERDYLSGEHAKATVDYKATHQNRELNQQDAVKGLLEADSKLYSQTMTDLAMGAGDKPIWAQLPFLDRYSAAGASKDPKAQLQSEIEVLRQEKQEFAAELEKAMRMLHLQKDIEKENQVYFEQEKQRLALIERSSHAKVEELAVRADDKSKTYMELSRKAETTKRLGGSPSRAPQVEEDAMSEFSVMSHESEIKADENILDFKIEDAEFYTDNFAQVSALGQNAYSHSTQKSFITLVTCDFYNHGTETSQMADGVRPNYQTQLSFKNKVDDFYVTFLQKQCLKMDVYLSKNNAAVHMGRCEVMLKELVEREVASQEVGYRTPLIERWAKIFPIGQSEGRPLGIVKYKMRLRKPITEQMRYFREKSEIANMTRAAQLQTGSLSSAKRLITIQIMGATQLKVKYSDLTDIAPFFYYQFFKFDERYSGNGAGTNPKFNDTFSYEVFFDSKATSYFEKECLEVILFDDNAPIAGASPDNVGAADDMIGVCKVPLKSLVAGCSTHDRYPIKIAGSTEVVGDLEVKISVTDLGGVAGTTIAGDTMARTATNMQYSKEWEDEVVGIIASKLAKQNCSIDLLFGIFSNSMRTATKEDFKHCILHRLNLNQEISEKEIDLLLMGCDFFANKAYIEREDFMAVFKNPIENAKVTMRANPYDQTNDFERDHTYGAHTQAHAQAHVNAPSTAQQMNNSQMVAQYNETEVLQILSDAIRQGYYNEINTQASRKVRGSGITKQELIQVLQVAGMIPEFDGAKVCQMIETDSSRVDHGRFQNLMARGLAFARDNSSALRKFLTAFGRYGRSLVRGFEQQDYNRDGLLNCDGFKAACLLPELGMPADELSEVFYLIANFNAELSYQEWLQDNFPIMQESLTIIKSGGPRTVERPESTLTGRDTINERSMGNLLIEQSISIGPETQPTIQLDGVLVSSAKTKIENYIRSQDINLGVIFAVLDTDSSKAIQRVEFRQKLKAMHMRLEDDEILALFKSLDGNNDGTIGYPELVESFSAINTQQLIRKMQRVIQGSKVEPEFFFTRFCRSDGTHSKMSNEDFSRMVKELYEKVTKPEILHVFHHFDKGRKGYITKQDFTTALKSEVRELSTGHHTGIEDIIKPLATKIRKLGVNIHDLFEAYDKNKNFRLSAEELREALTNQGLHLDAEEVQTIREFFQNRFKSNEITKQQFIELISTRFEKKSDAQEARKSLSDLRSKFDAARKTPKQLMTEYNNEPTELINQRAFKIAIHSLKVLSQYNIDNLAKFLDKNNEGFISIGDFDAQIRSAAPPSSSLSRTLSSTGRSNKWTKQ